jgi:hypothetical protein
MKIEPFLGDPGPGLQRRRAMHPPGQVLALVMTPKPDPLHGLLTMTSLRTTCHPHRSSKMASQCWICLRQARLMSTAYEHISQSVLPEKTIEHAKTVR